MIIDIADAVTAELNANTFSQSFTAARAYRPVFDLAEMKNLHVTVVPKSVDIENASRELTQSDVQIDIGIQKKLSASTDERTQLDALMQLVEEIADFLRQHSLSGVDASWVKTANSPIFAPEHLEQLRQFTSVLTVTYRVLR